ncbi:S8 family serine peptidase [Caldalkalibacillus salinus]|uniref:S8 family serine peptidase n=1 Tax=Caldalkalibacillus salinus TaxID=2803787 RepID=UPI0019231338|nr:S8 family serine peptidase [Caldalkalibacillus salinus]
MKKVFRHSIVITAIFALLLSTLGTGVLAQGVANEEGQHEPAPLYGTFDLQSDEKVTVMVELQEPSIMEAKHQGQAQDKKALATEREQVVSALKAKVSDLQVNREYDYLFSGLSIDVPANELPHVLAVTGVEAVYPNVTYEMTSDDNLISSEAYTPHMADSAPYIGADTVWETLGYTGEGVTVAIIDTGVDYTHPDLTHAFGAYKGWDFVDNDNDPQETPVGDPRGGSTRHGTHVAGTVAANGLIKGIAPDAQLLGYRVLGPGGSGTTTDVVAGIERAVQDGADVMNLSLGNSLNNPDWATSIALDWAMAEGVVAVTSNGNAGPNNWTVGSPGTSRMAISVGATQLPYNVYDGVITTTQDVYDYPSSAVMGYESEEDLLALGEGTFDMVYVGMGYEEDFAGKDLNGKIAVISRGEFAFVDKATNAKNAGAVGAIIFNNVEGDIPYEIPGMAVPTLKLDDVDGQKLVAEIEAGYHEVSFGINFSKQIDETVADFSSRGPVMDTWMIKPDVSAPGVNITSSVPTHNPDDPHGYASMQGTSMAAPHVAGAAALLLQAHPEWGPEQVKAALMNTAEPLFDPNGDSYKHNDQGAGSIRLVEAIEVDTLVSPGSHSFGVFDKDAGRQVERQHFTIENLSNETKRYDISVTFDDQPQGIDVKTSQNTKVDAHSAKAVNMNVRVRADQLEAGYYEGKILISDGEHTTEVPTILFVQEPDYPRITSFSLTETEEGYEYTVYLPSGAEEVGLWVYTASPFEYVGDGGVHLNVSGEDYETLTWDGKVNGEALTPGTYYVYAYATKQGQTDYAGPETLTID